MNYPAPKKNLQIKRKPTRYTKFKKVLDVNSLVDIGYTGLPHWFNN